MLMLNAAPDHRDRTTQAFTLRRWFWSRWTQAAVEPLHTCWQKYGMHVIDCGVPVLSMHAPWEIANKADIYEAYRGYRAFLEFSE